MDFNNLPAQDKIYYNDGDGRWIPVLDGDPRAVGLYRRHYSCHQTNHGQPIDYVRYGFSGKGESMIMLTLECNALWCWRLVVGVGVYCSVFRNESKTLSSELIKEADTLAWARWKESRHYTHVDPKKTRHKRQPGRCFLKAGWHYANPKYTKKGLLILEIETQSLGRS